MKRGLPCHCIVKTVIVQYFLRYLLCCVKGSKATMANGLKLCVVFGLVLVFLGGGGRLAKLEC